MQSRFALSKSDPVVEDAVATTVKVAHEVCLSIWEPLDVATCSWKALGRRSLDRDRSNKNIYLISFDLI